MTPSTRTLLPFCILFSCLGLFAAGRAHGGGYEFPANGTEALGRGGAFTAKADSPLALEYNVAGLAQQRGTRLLFDNNLYFSSLSFDRTGMFPGSTSDSADSPFYAPFFGLSTDFGYFDRLTFAIGVFGPSAIGKRLFPSDMMHPGPARYDVVSTDNFIVYPTIAAAFRVGPHLDIGLAFEDAIGLFKLANIAYIPTFCSGEAMTMENPKCDGPNAVDAKSFFNPILALGVLGHIGGLDLGLHIRSAPNLGTKSIEGSGTLTAAVMDHTLDAVDAQFSTNLPWVFRLGIRYAFRKSGREVGDIELDGVLEAWSLAEGEGSHLNAENPLLHNQMNILLAHRYKDTGSVRLGGAFNQPLGLALLTLRAGVFYDSSATNSADTRLDFDTLDKIAGTAGLGLGVRGVTLNVAYAYVHSFERTVQDGRLLPLDGSTGMDVKDSRPINNGTYRGSNQIASLGLLVQFDELVKGERWARRPAR